MKNQNPTQQFSLAGKTALITGSTRGIGEALARGFAAAGASVWVHGRKVASGHRIADGLNGKFVQADLTQSAAIQELATRIANEQASLDILVNNAGLEVIMPFEDIDMPTFDRIWSVNVRAAVELTYLLLPLLKRSGAASIINLTSIHDTMPYPNNAAYSMSKAALAMFTKTLAVELAPYGIRVNNFAPGAIETDINREVIEAIGHDKFEEWIPAGRVGQIDEMIGPALFLASNASSYVTGTTLYADGGYLQHLVRYRPKQ